MDFKKQLFWIVSGLVLVLGIGGYFFMISGITSADGKTTEELESACRSKVELFDKIAKKPEDIINAEHVRLAKEYKARVEAEVQNLQELWKTKKLDLRFQNVPTDSLAFDSWLNEFRDRINKQAAAAGLQLPPDADKMMFKEPSTSDAAEDVTRHRAFRLRQVALIEEVVNILCKKYGKQQKLKFEPELDKPEPQELVDVGAVSLERLSILPSKNIVPKNAMSVATAEDRIKTVFEDAVKRAGRSTAGPAVKPVVIPDLPIAFTGVDVQFVAPLHTIPAIVQALESSNRYTAVVTRIDFQRAASPFPTSESKLTSTTGLPVYTNSHFQEAPVRVLVSLDLYEYDSQKEAATAAAAAAAAAAAKAPGKSDSKKKPGR